jgi:hypothetical protein
MAKLDFLSMTIKQVEFMYPKLDSTYRWNPIDRQSEKCAQTADGAKWQLTWVMDKVRGDELTAQLQKHYAECKARDAKRPAFGKVFGSKVLEDGRISFSATRNGKNQKEESAPAPEVVGADTKPLADRAIWSGSTGNLMISAIPTTDAGGVGGIKLLLGKVQVVNPVYGSAGAGFEDETANVVAVAPADSEWG